MRDPQPDRRRRASQRTIRRRRVAAFAALAAIGATAAWALAGPAGGNGTTTRHAPPASRTVITAPAAPSVPNADAVARPGRAHLVFSGPTTSRRVALTFDDGFCTACIGSIIQTLARTATPATLFPNGIYADSWGPNAASVRALVASGQIDLGNHTWSHDDARYQTAAVLSRELRRNDAWLRRTFGTSSLPIFRPPFGTYNKAVLSTSGRQGYTTVVTWSGGSRDWESLSAEEIVRTVRAAEGPGVIFLLHVNYRTTADALPRIIANLRADGYEPVTLRALLGIPA